MNPIDELNSIPGTLAVMGRAVAPSTPEAPMEVDPGRPLWEVDDAFLNPFAPVEEVQTWAHMGDRPAIPCQGLIAISAKPKQGKSHAIYAVLLPILTGSKMASITPTERRPARVVVFDNEMDKPTLTKRLKMMHGRLGNDATRFYIVPMMHIAKKDRVALMERIINLYNPDIVVLDQAARMVENFNDPTECSLFGEWAQHIAATRTMFVVIHQNKSADDTKMKGHLGSLLAELAVENYSVSRSNGVFTLMPVEARSTNCDNAAPFQFALSDDGEIITADDVLQSNKEKEADQWRKDFAVIFGDDDEVSFGELKKRIMARNLSAASADRKIENARACGAIAKVNPADRKSPYRITLTAAEEFNGI